MNVPQEIMNQIKTLGRIEMMSWGSHAFKAISDKMLVEDFGSHLGALSFKVSGRIFSGDVAIVLMPNDTYTVRLGRLVKGRFNTKQMFDDVYVDNLIDVIDSNVETK